MRLDGNAALTFEVHRIEKLVLFIALVNRARCLEQSIGERRLPMIDMRDDAEVSGQLDRHKAVHYAGVRMMGQSGRVPSPFLTLALARSALLTAKRLQKNCLPRRAAIKSLHAEAHHPRGNRRIGFA